MDVGDLLVRQLEELPGAGRERARRQRLEGIANLLLHRVEQGQLLGDDPLAMRQLGRESSLIGAQGRDGVGGAGPCNEPADQPAQGEREQRGEHERKRHYNLDAV